MRTFCVIHDKEFVAKAKLLGLSEDSLDRVIYEYRANHQGENPSDDYIRALFLGTNIVSLESYDNARTVWENKYSSDILFASNQELLQAKRDALKYFAPEAIKDFTDSEGHFVLRVAPPTVSNTENSSAQEMQQIKDNAIANGTFMLAPNGRQSNLSEQQWLQVRTKAFKAWFGDWESVAKQRFNKWGAFNKTRAIYQGIEVSGQTFDADMAPDGGRRIISINGKYIGEIPTVETEDRIQMSGSIGAATSIEPEFRGKGYGKKAHIALALIAAKDGKTLYSDSSNSDAEDALWKSLIKDGIAEVIKEGNKVNGWNTTEYRIINDKLPQGEVHGFDENVSKVVDENGEPLVVYHGTQSSFNTIDFNKSDDKLGFYSARTTDTSDTYGLGNAYSLFYNLKNPYIVDGQGHQWNDLMLNWEDYTEEEQNNIHKQKRLTTRDITKYAKEHGYDGVIFMSIIDQGEYSGIINEKQSLEIEKLFEESVEDNYYAKSKLMDFLETLETDVFVAIASPNQIKSATDNVGTFSSANNDIFANRNFDQYYKYLFEMLQRKVKSKEATIKQINAVNGTNFGYRNGRFFMNAHPKLHGVKIEGIDKKINIKHLIARDELMNYLVDKFGLNYQEISDKEFSRRFGPKLVNNAIVIGNTVYVRQSKVLRLTNEQLIEEFLHPTVHAIAGADNNIFENLLAEAKKEFSLLDSQIRALYADQSEQVQNEELVTQVLSRYVNKEISDLGTNTRNLIDYIKQFFNWIADLFKDLFGLFTFERNSRPTFSGKDILDVLNFENLAQLINTRNVRFRDTLQDNIGFNSRTIIYNEGQKEAISKATDFVLKRLQGTPTEKQYFTIEGEAGTGKTTIINAVIKNLVDSHKRVNVHVSAVSHKATTNIYDKVKTAIPLGSRVQLEHHTIAGELGATMNEETGEFTLNKDSYRGRESYIEQADVIFIDEASMINEEAFEFIDSYVKKDPRLTVIFLGDLGQLPPIRKSSYYETHSVPQNADSPVFNKEISDTITLTERVRQGEGSPILEVSHRLHEAGLPQTVTGEDLNEAVKATTTDIITDQGAIIYKKGGNKGSFLDMIEDAFKVSRDSNNPFHIKIVSYTNDSVSTYNSIIRKVLFPDTTEYLVPKDIITFYSESAVIGSKSESIHNSEDFSVVQATPHVDKYGVRYYDVALTDGDRTLNTQIVLRSDKGNYTKWKSVKNSLWTAYRTETDPLKKKELKEAARRYSYESYGEADYGYAITSHKAQGSTYDISVVDLANILAVGPVTFKSKIQSLYTAVTRAANAVIIISDVDNGSTVNIEEVNNRIANARFGDSPVTEAPTTPSVSVSSPIEIATPATPIVTPLPPAATSTETPIPRLASLGILQVGDPKSKPSNYDEAIRIVPTNPEERTFLNSLVGHQLRSGGAYGADTLWDIIGSAEFGLEQHNIHHYRTSDNSTLSMTLRGAPFYRTGEMVDSSLDVARLEIERLLQMSLPPTLQGNLKARNYFLVINSDVVIAIATISHPITNQNAWMNFHVSGGTDVAVQLGIALNKPVYVFDPVQNQWAVFKPNAVAENTGGFIPTIAPSLYEYTSFAGVGTRDIESYNIKNKEGKWVPNPRYLGDEARMNAIKAIRLVYANTVIDRANMDTALPLDKAASFTESQRGETNKDIQETVNKIKEWYKYQKTHTSFDRQTHSYYIDGVKADYSVTQYMEEVYGKPNILGDYSHSQAIGNDVDALTRDFFLGKDVNSINYANLNNDRKTSLIEDLKRLKSYFDASFTDAKGKPSYKVITSEFTIAAKINTAKGEKTIAGTVDMIVIDSKGNIHIFDMKTKNHPITTIFNGAEVNDRRNYTFLLNAYRQIIESILPEFNGKIQDLRLIWFDTNYPKQGKEAKFVTDASGVVTVSDDTVKDIPLSEYRRWQTPSLKYRVNESLIPLEITSPLGLVTPLNSDWILDNKKEQEEGIQSTSNSVLPGPETRINIYAGTNENADLSNFAIRPFRHQYRDGAHKDFQSVEQAFQYIKASQFADTRANDGIARGGKSIEVEIMETTNGAELRKLGRSVKELNVQAWDRAASAVMKELLKESFEQNPQTLQRLLATGNATLTHVLDKSKWGKEFPNLLMQVRDELKASNSTVIPNKEPSIKEKQVVSNQYADSPRPIMPSYKAEAEEKIRKVDIYDWEETDTEFLGYKLKYVDSIAVVDKEEIGARNPHDGTILLNMDALRLKYEDKKWKDPARSLANIPDFQTFLEMMTWVLLHEIGHDFKERYTGEESIAYETRVNEWANTQIQRKLNKEAQELQDIDKQANLLFKVESLENTSTKYTAMNTLTVNPKKVNKATRKEALTKALFNLPISSQLTIVGIPTVETFQTIKLMREVGMNPTNTTIPVDLNGNDNLIRAAKAARLEVTEDGKVRMPAFIKGLTEEELTIIKQNKIFTESGLFRASELNVLAKMTVFKVSELITMLLSQLSANQKLFGDEFQDTDFVGKSRIDIISQVGLYKLFDVVRERVFNTTTNDLIAFNAQDKADLIYDNFEAFMLMGFSSLINMEEISLDGLQETKTDINDVIDPEDEQTILEVFGSSAEHWQVGFRQISAYSSLSQLIKRTIEKLYVIDKDGNLTYNEFGLAETVNPQDAVTQMLNWVQYAETIDDMINKLKAHVDLAPWLNYLINDNSDPNNPVTATVGGLGKLVGNDELFKSLFYSNFKKYFLKYSITFKDNDDKTVIKIINEHGVSDEEFASIFARYESYDLGHFPLRNTNGTVNLKELNKLKTLGSELAKLKELDANAFKIIKNIASILTINTDSDENLKLTLTGNDVLNIAKKVRYIVEAFERLSNDSKVNPFSGKLSIVNDIKAIITTLNRVLNESLESVSYEAGKMYYSYVMPSYLNKLVGKLQGHLEPNNGETAEEAYQRFLKNEYGLYKWFFDTKTNKWRNYILLRLAEDPSVRKGFDHKASLHFLGVNYVDKSPAEYVASLVLEFLYDDNKKWAWYRIPTMANKPSEEYFKFLRFHEGYKDAISNLMVNVFIQELNRIATVEQRIKTLPKDLLIKNFDYIKDVNKRDGNGLKFQFLDFLEEYRNASTEKGKTEFGLLLRNALSGDISATNGAAYNNLIQQFKEVLGINMEEHFKTAVTKWKNEGFVNDLFESSLIDLGKTPAEREEILREYFWNDAFMTTLILEMTITDIAYYKDTEDLQKRLAQLHAPGMRGNILAKDIKTGNLVTDGLQRTFYIKDDVIKADVLENLKVVEELLKKKAKNNVELNQIEALFADIIKAFKDTNFADAQAYSSPTSYRKKMHIFGKWDLAQEDLYDKIIKGEGTVTDLEILWQPLKPFVYSLIGKSSPGLFDKIKIGVQNKNSEYLLIITDAILRGNQKPNRLSALFDIMEESAHTNGEINNFGIDTVQFESTVKAGLTGIININDDAFIDVSNISVDDIKKVITDKIYTTNEEGQRIYNEKYVHSIPFEDYAMQQENPAHFKGEQQQGSQNRILALSDTPNTKPDGTPNYIKVHNKVMTVKDAKERYFKAILENINDSTQEIIRRFRLDNADPKMRNIALSRMLRDEILKDSRFDSEMLWACSVDIDGNFNIPLSDPTLSNRIQQLLNSIIKNNIDKQKIAGGPVIQVSNYGTSSALSVRFKDAQENILLSRNEFEEIRAKRMTVKYSAKRQSSTEENGITVLRGKYSLPVKKVKDKNGEEKTIPYTSYEEYLKDRQYTFAYLEAYAPLLNELFVEDFSDENGNIDMEKIERVAPDLLEMIAYRIPTEAKYSILPIKIIGFLPASAGEGIMLPAEITTMTGSDFDVDKMYIMRHLLKRTEKVSETKLAEEYEKFIQEGNEDTLEQRRQFRLKNYDKIKQPVYSRFDRGRLANNDIIIDTLWANLTSPEMLTQVWTPGNFNEPKHYGYLILALSTRLSELAEQREVFKKEGYTERDIEFLLQEKALEVYNELKDLSTDALKEQGYRKKNLIYADTQMDFHRQNMVAAKLIGVFALANVSHAFIGLKACEGTPCTLNLTSAAMNMYDDDLAFVLNGKIMEGTVYIDLYLNYDGVRESALLASLLAASVDAVKDPVLNLMNINIDTVNIAVTLIRLGFSIQTAALLLSQPYVKQLLVNFNKVKQSTSLRDYIAFTKTTLMKQEAFNPENLWLNRFRYTDEFFIKNFGSTNNMDRIVILDLLEKLLRISDAFSMITHMTRYNSITAAVGPFASDTMDMKLKDEDFYNSKLITLDLVNAVNNPILKAFREDAYKVEELLLGRNIILASPSFLRILKTLKERIGYLSGEIAGSFSDFFMSYYMLLGTTLVFDQSDERRKYMLTQYATDFLGLKQKYPENALVKAIHFNAANNNELYPFLSLNLRGRNNDDVLAAKAGWVELLNKDKKAALDLAEYCFFRGGMGFSPKTFTRIMPNAVKAALSSYIAKLNNYRDNIFTDEHVERMINLFILHNVGDEGSIKLRTIKVNNNILSLNNVLKPQEIDDLINKKVVSIPVELEVKEGKDKMLKVRMYYGLHKVALNDKLLYVFIGNGYSGGRTIQIVDALGGRKEGLELNTTQAFPLTVFNQPLLEAQDTPVTPTTEDALYNKISALMFNLYNSLELSELETIDDIESSEMSDFIHDIQVRYENSLGRMTTQKEKIRLYNSKAQVAKILQVLKTLMPNLYREVLNKANLTLNEINLCS